MKTLFTILGAIFLGGILFISFSENTLAIPDGKIPGEGNTFEAPAPEEVPEELNNPNFREQLLNIISYFLTFVGIIAVAALIYYGFLWLVSGGNEEQIETGKKGIIYVALGIFVILFSYVLVAFLIDAGNGPNANASQSQYITKEEQEIVVRLDALQGMVYQAYEYTLSFAQELKNEYNALFVGIPNTEERQIFEYHLTSGVAKNEHLNIQRQMEDLRNLTLKFESTEEDDQHGVQKQIDSVLDNMKGSFKNIKNAFEDIPRMEASISVKPKDGSVPLTVSINGLESSDPTNTTIPSANYSWSFTDYDGIEKNLGSGPNKVITFEEPGNYIILLKVKTASRENVLPGYSTVSVVVEPQGLTADFLVDGVQQGSIVKIPLHNATKGIRFDPSTTIIPEGAMATEYIWSFGGEKRSTGSDQQVVSQNFTKEGQFTVSLTVTDNTGEESTKKIKIVIESSIAVIDTSTAKPLLGEIVTINGQRSTQEGSPATVYYWKIFDSEGVLIRDIEDRPQFSHQFDSVGMYTIQLDVGNGITASKQIEVQSKPPVASFTAQKENPANMAEVIFNASTSYDPEKGPLLYHWDFDGDGSLDIQNETSPYIKHTYVSKGDFQPRLVVTDEHGNSSNAFRDIRIDSLFFVDFSVDSFAVHAGEEVRFFINTNEGPLFLWDFGDGNTKDSQELVEKHMFSQPGQYQIRLTAYNSEGESVSAEKSLYVGGEGEPIPVVFVKKDGVPIPIKKDLCGSEKGGISLFRYEMLEFSGDESVDSQGASGSGLEYRWNIGGEEKRGANISQKFIQTTPPGSCLKATLVVTDVSTEKTVSSGPIYLSVKNALPELSEITATPESSPCVAPCQLTLAAVGASDPDGVISEYRWWATTPGKSEKIGVHLSVEPESNIVLPALGHEGQENTFVVHLEIVDSDGDVLVAEDVLPALPQVSVINGENPGYTVDFFVERSSLMIGEEFVFTAKVQNPLGDAIPESSYMWDFDGDGVVDGITGSQVRHAYDTQGEYNVRLDVEHRGISNTKTRKIYVTEQKQYPIADFSASTKGLRASFDAGNTEWNQSAYNTPPEYQWDFDATFDSDNDGIPDNDSDATGEKTEHIYTQKGLYSVRLFTYRPNGDSDRITKQINVGESSPSLSQNDTIIRSAKITGNAPSVTFDLLVRIPDDPTSPAEVIAYGFSPDGSLLTGEVLFETTGSVSSLVSGSAFLERGQASTFLVGDRTPDEPYTVTATAKTPFGSLKESISF